MIEVLTNPVVVAGIFTILGGIALKVLEAFLNRNQEKQGMRRDHLSEITALSDRLDRVEAEVTSWRGAYYKLQAYTASLQYAMAKEGMEIPDAPETPNL